MMRFSIPRTLFSLGIVLCLLSACSHVKPDLLSKTEESHWFGDKAVTRYELKNGLKIIVLEDHSAPTFAYQTWYNVGSMDEEKGLTGLAHLFEHMMFKATKNHPEGEFDRMLEAAGAEGENAFTNRDYTAYVQSMPRTGKANTLDLIMKLEAERMVNLIVNKDSLDKEREVVQNERRFRNENSPDGSLYERIYEMAYKKHSYHWPVIGYAQDLRNAKVEDCYAFYKKFYAPNNATVVVVGDVSKHEVLSLAEKYYKDLPASNIQRTNIAQEPAQTAERKETMSLNLQVEKLFIAYHIPDLKHADYPSIQVLANVLTEGKSSRLYQKLVDTGIASEVDATTDDHKQPGLMIFFISLQKGKTANQALRILDQELETIMKGDVKQEELNRSMSQHRYSVFDDLASVESKARFIGQYETMTGRFENGIDFLNAIKNVGAQEVSRAAKIYLTKKNRSVLTGMPSSQKGKSR